MGDRDKIWCTPENDDVESSDLPPFHPTKKMYLEDDNCIIPLDTEENHELVIIGRENYMAMAHGLIAKCVESMKTNTPFRLQLHNDTDNADEGGIFFKVRKDKPKE